MKINTPEVRSALREIAHQSRQKAVTQRRAADEAAHANLTARAQWLHASAWAFERHALRMDEAADAMDAESPELASWQIRAIA